MSLNDQWEHGRIPLKPLPYNVALNGIADTGELIIDYTKDEAGNDPSYHIYISSPDNNKELIDITQKIITEILPNAKINANQFQILIEGIKDPSTLQDIINYIYKRFAYPENSNGFDYDRDIGKVFDPTATSVLLRNTDGTVLLPVTLAKNVYDESGKSIQDRLDDMTRLGFSMTYAVADTDNQTQFEFTYPFPNYSDFVEVRIGTVYVDKTRYSIVTDRDVCKDENGDIVKGIIKFNNVINPNDTSVSWMEHIERGRRVDILFIYNALAKSDGKYEYMYGGNIANFSIPSIKLEKISDAYTLDDSTSVASSAAVFNLFTNMADIISNNVDNAIWTIDSNTTNSLIEVKTSKTVINSSSPTIINVVIKTAKVSTVKLKITDASTNKTYSLIYPDGSSLTRGIPANKTIRIIISGSTAYILSAGLGTPTYNYCNYYCKDQETKISYNGLSYNDGDTINVYRNGVRLFLDVDYWLTKSEEYITLSVRTEDGERIVFEAVTTN